MQNFIIITFMVLSEYFLSCYYQNQVTFNIDKTADEVKKC